MSDNEKIHEVHCHVPAAEWRLFRAALALRGETVRDSLRRWLASVVSEMGAGGATRACPPAPTGVAADPEKQS